MQTFLDLINPQIHAINYCESRNWSNAWRIIYDHQLLLVRGARIESSFESGETVINEPDSFIIKPAGVPHSSRQITRGTVSFRWVHFDWIHKEGEMTASSPRVCRSPSLIDVERIRKGPDFLPRQIFRGSLTDCLDVFQAFDRMQERWNCGTPVERAGCRALLLEILIRLLGESEGFFVEQSDDDYSHQLARRTREILNRLLENPRTARAPLKDAVEKLGYSYPHICRIFKRAYGVSPIIYFNQIRMGRACVFLRETSLPINEIARNIGIDNASYFTRLFLKYCGKSPKSFRNNG